MQTIAKTTAHFKKLFYHMGLGIDDLACKCLGQLEKPPLRRHFILLMRENDAL